MQGTLTAPGLYLRGTETPPAPPLESGVAGFVGIAERGPLNSPQPLTGWSEYVDTFGGFVPFGYLADSVFGFFRNGGEKCVVVRVADTSLLGASTPAGQCVHTEPLAAATVVLADHNGDDCVRVTALDPGGWGNAIGLRVASSVAPPLRVGVLTQATTAAATEIFVDSVVDLRPGGSIRVTDPDGTNVTDLAIVDAPAALNPALGRVQLTGAVGDVFPAGSRVDAAGLRIEAAFRGRRELFDRLSVRVDHPRYFVPLINGPEPIADYGERRRRGFSSLVRVDHLSGGGTTFVPVDAEVPLAGGGDGFSQARGTFLDAASDPLLTVVARGGSSGANRGSAGNGVSVVARPFMTTTALPVPDSSGAVDRIVVDEIDGFQPGDVIRIGDEADPLAETVSADAVDAAAHTIEVQPPLARAYAVGTPVVVPDRFTLEVRHAGEREPREVIRNVSGRPVAGPRFVRTALAAESELLCADTPAAPFDSVVPPGVAAVEVELAGGADPGRIDARYYTGYLANGAYFHPPELPTASLVGLATLEAADEVSLIAVPDLVRVGAAGLGAAQTSVLRHCARLGERFALLDSPGADAGLDIEEWAAGLGDAALRRFGAAFHPWLHTTTDGAGGPVPPSGSVAGLYARSDRTRGVNKAPANARLRGAFGLEPTVDRTRQAALNPLGVNCALKLEAGELRLMGARTLSGDAVARYVNIRRTILSVKKTLARRMLWAVFEPTGPELYRRIESTLTTFLESLLAKGVTASQRSTDAFYVRCDETTNPAAQVRAGTVVAEIGIALLAPAEFIVLTARRTPDAVQVIEEEV